MFDRFTDRAKKVMNLARQEAQRFNHEYLSTEHILLGLVEEGGGVAARVIESAGIELGKIRTEVEKILKTGPSMVTMGQLPFTPRAKKVLELSMEEAGNFGHNYIGTEHLLLGMLKEHDGIAGQVLRGSGVTLEGARTGIVKFLGEHPEPRLAARASSSAYRQRLGIPTGDFTDRLKGLWSVAMELAVAKKSPTVLPEHALVALLSDSKGIGADVLRSTHADVANLRSTLESLPTRSEKRTDAALVMVDPLLRIAISLAQEEMRDTRQTTIGTGHLLVGLLRQGGECARILVQAGLELEPARAALRECLRKIDADPIWDHIG